MNWLIGFAGMKTYNPLRGNEKIYLFFGAAANNPFNQSFLHSNQKEKHFFFLFIQQSLISLIDGGKRKKYYNSNLYEADSYLVIIIECFCEEWTNTWNWLRRELVAELPQAAVGEKKVNGINKEIHESIMKSIWEIDWMVDEWDWIIDGMGPAPANQKEKFTFLYWLRPPMKFMNLFVFVFSLIGGLWPLAAARGSAKRRERRQKTNEWMNGIEGIKELMKAGLARRLSGLVGRAAP